MAIGAGFFDWLIRRNELSVERYKARLSNGASPGDRFWLFSVAAAALAVLGVLVFVLGFTEKNVNEVLFGSLITGLLMIVQKVIEAQGMRQAMQKLGESQPVGPDGHSTTENMDVEADTVTVKGTRK